MRNTLVTYAGRFVGAAASILLLPVYVHVLGVRSYGLIGLYAALQGIVNILDLGFSWATNREIARLNAAPEPNLFEKRSLLRSYETVFWGLAASGALLVSCFSSPLILNLGMTSAAETAGLLRVAIMAILIRFPYALYSSVLLGLERHLLLNSLAIGLTLLRALGSVLVVMKHRSVEALFYWFTLSAAADTLALAVTAWACLKGGFVASRVSLERLRATMRFSIGVGSITITAALVAQTDKVLLPVVVGMDQYGLHSIASTVALGVLSLVYPLSGSLYPRLSALHARQDLPEMRRLYRRFLQIAVCVSGPICVTLIFFGPEFMELYLSDQAAARRAGTLLRGLALGTLGSSLVIVPHIFQLAVGRTSLLLTLNLLMLAVGIPCALYFAYAFGLTTSVWIAAGFNVLHVASLLVAMHRHLLPEDLGYCLRLQAAPLLLGSLVGALCFLLLPSKLHPSFALPLTYGGVLSAMILMSPEPRAFLFSRAPRPPLPEDPEV